MPISINSKDKDFPGVSIQQDSPVTGPGVVSGTGSGTNTARSFFMTMLTDEDRISNDELKRVQVMGNNQNTQNTQNTLKAQVPGNKSNRVGNNAQYNNNPNNAGSLPATPSGGGGYSARSSGAYSARSRDGSYSARSRDGSYSARNATLDKISISAGEGKCIYMLFMCYI